MPNKSWEIIIGLEIHAELNTKSKLFSTAANRFGDEPNTNISAVCTGMPGALPVLNKEAVHKAVQFGCAINGKVAHFSKFDRKSYFYPDSPRNFQITQYDEPIVIGGEVTVEVEGKEKTLRSTESTLKMMRENFFILEPSQVSTTIERVFLLSKSSLNHAFILEKKLQPTQSVSKPFLSISMSLIAIWKRALFDSMSTFLSVQSVKKDFATSLKSKT